ncbi:MAG: aldo/keto reductase [Actinobacteria bacterium]|nr:aldo/keto reductase [Actinomycetota bacterium]
MEYRKLGNSDLDVSVITLGTWSYGCTNYWGEIPEKEAIEALKKSVDSGINMIDTAIGYSDSELVVGKAIKGLRDKVSIVSKGGASPKRIPVLVEHSLQRLGIDYLDLYLVHYPDLAVPIEETIEAMAKIQKEGKVRYIGVSNFNSEQLERAVAVAPITACQSAYNLMWREIEAMGILDTCIKHNIAMLTYSSLGQGLFTGSIRSKRDIPQREGDIRTITLFFKDEAFDNSLKMVDILDGLAAKYKKTVAQVALNWVIYNKPGITTALVGIINIQQLNDNLGAIGWKMEQSDYDMLTEKGRQLSSMFDYSAYSMFGMKWEEIKVDDMLANC